MFGRLDGLQFPVRNGLLAGIPHRHKWIGLFTEISRGIDKWLWFVEAHLQAER
jgi:hypothetical protein